MKLIDLFGGGGLASWGFQNLGIEVVAAVDISPSACFAYQANFPKSVVFQDKVSNSINRLRAIAPPDCVLHLSPPCQSFSAAANINRKKVRPSIASEIDASIELIRQIKPLLISLEEVPRFSKSAEAEKLRLALWKLGYWLNESVVDCSSIGLPQNRKRLIWRAVADELSCKLRAGAALAPGLFDQKFWFGLEPKKELHSGWYSAVADLLEKESESHLADWQMRMLLNFTALAESSWPVLLPRAGASVKKFSIRSSEQPSPTVRALELSRTWHLFDALLDCFQGKECYLQRSNQPSITIAASWKALLQGDFKVKALSPRAIARLQGVSDFYELVGTKSQQVTILGNGVPPLLIEKMWRPVLNAVA